MGNTPASTRNPLTRNWHPLAPGLLQHAHTQQLIREHTLALPSPEARAQLARELSLRMAQHHPHVAQPIYFRNSEEDCQCSPKQEYSLLLYTEHEGSPLTDLPHPPTECYCLPIVTTLEHLQDLYGSFAVWEGLVFLSQRADQPASPTLKLWIHSKVQSCRRERPSSESEMVHSTLSMLGNLRRSHNCKFVWDCMHLANTMRELREEMGRPRLGESRRHRKSHSASLYQPGSRNQTHTSNHENEKKSAKASSMPPRNEERDRERHSSLNEAAQGKKEAAGSNGSVRQTADAKFQIGSFAVGGQEVQSRNNPSSKINFSYSHHYPPHAPHPIQHLQSTPPSPPPTPHTQLPTPFIPELPIGQTHPNPRQPAPQSLSSNNPAVSIVISHSMQSSPPVKHPISHIERPSQQSIRRNQQRQEVNFISREMELPIFQLKDSPGTAKLPTTSRSPERLKDHLDPECHTTHSQPKPQPPSKRSEKSGSVHSSGNKFEKYSHAIKEYEEKLKQRLSAGGKTRASKPVRSKRVEKAVVTPTATADYKETKSLYNDSGDEQESSRKRGRESQESWKRLQEEEQLRFKREEEERRWREQENKADFDKAAKEVERKRRQQMEKIELQRDLQKERKMIQNEMQDLLRHNAMKEQYRSIREKVKQKKETFAELKAEATKILQDLGY